MERRDDKREAKLAHIRELVAAGSLVIRPMTKAEQKKWAKRHDALAASWTPEERARRAAFVEGRRKRAKRSW